MASDNSTIHKNTGTKQNTGNATMHKNPGAGQKNGNPTMHKNPGAGQKNGNPTMHKSPGAGQKNGNPTMHKNSGAAHNAGIPTAHKPDGVYRGFEATTEAKEKLEEYFAAYEEDRKVWMKDGWGEAILAPEETFHGYKITGKLVKKADPSQTVGTESVGIYRGFDGKKEVLIKILNSVDEELEKLVNDTMISISRSTPALATYYEAGHDTFVLQDGYRHELTYEIMEFCGDKSLEDIICSDRKKFDSDDLDKFIRDMMDGLEVMQQHKVFHSDLKPSNIMYKEAENQYIIVDFGTARNWEEHSKENLLGKGWTEYYKAPELSNPNAAVNHADFYSLGQIIFYLATGGYLALWVLPDDENSEKSGNRKISLTEYVEKEQGRGWFSRPLARLYDGLSKVDAASRYNCDDIRAWLENTGIDFAGHTYQPNDMDLYKAMGKNWEAAKKFLFESQELKEAYESMGRNNGRLMALQKARQEQRANPQSADMLLGKFLLEVQGGIPQLWYKEESYSDMEDFADKYLNSLRKHNSVKERDVITSGLLSIFCEKLGKELPRQQADFIKNNIGKNVIADEDAFGFCYNVLKKTTIMYQGTEYESKEELFKIAKKKLAASYEEYMEFCYDLNKSAEFKVWSSAVGGGI